MSGEIIWDDGVFPPFHYSVPCSCGEATRLVPIPAETSRLPNGSLRIKVVVGERVHVGTVAE